MIHFISPREHNIGTKNEAFELLKMIRSWSLFLLSWNPSERTSNGRWFALVFLLAAFLNYAACVYISPRNE